MLGVLVPALYVGGWVLSEAGFQVPLSTDHGIPWVFFVCVAAVAVLSSLAGVIGGSMAGAWSGAVQFLVVAIGGARICHRGDPRCGRTGEPLEYELAGAYRTVSVSAVITCFPGSA